MDEQEVLFKTVPNEILSQLSREDLILLYKGENKLARDLKRINEDYESQISELRQRSLFVEDQYITLKNKFYGKSSERLPKKDYFDKEKRAPKRKIQLPSLRYPNAPLIEREVELHELPSCTCCGNQMKDSGMTADSEFLTAIPRQFFVVRLKRHKYSCGKCHGDIKTAPVPPRIKPGASYSDEMMIDVAISKYCDLIPIERYVQMGSRSGIKDLPANSLIQTTHNLAEFVEDAYKKLKTEVISSKILHADETPHRMLEGDKKSNWYMWGFSTDQSSYFEMHNTRSGNVASELLKDSQCEYLVSDVFSGYAKAVRESNEYRKDNLKYLIKNIYCNAHARRRFKESLDKYEKESHLFLRCYQKIYRLQKKEKDGLSIKKTRKWQRLYFRLMERRAISLNNSYSSKSSFGKAITYFLKNYEELTYFLNFEDLPLDNNSQERLMRNPVIGRKTWYGTHSKKGAKTASILFSLVESCKLNKLNPREYFTKLVESIHQGENILTPKEMAENS